MATTCETWERELQEQRAAAAQPSTYTYSEEDAMAAGADDTDMEDTLDSSVVEPGSKYCLLMTDRQTDGLTQRRMQWLPELMTLTWKTLWTALLWSQVGMVF